MFNYCTFIIYVLIYFDRNIRSKKSIWVKPGRTDQWWRNLKSDKMSSNRWKSNLRISKEDFRVLVEMIRPFAVARSFKVRRDVLSLEKRVAITLHYLKNQGSMWMTANAFGIAR